ncbi:MAG: hypothetical protein MUF64_05475 [Polyangiaceae bacterium]|nr:hypothetical protein [Polyangiaceae bacterium]
MNSGGLHSSGSSPELGSSALQSGLRASMSYMNTPRPPQLSLETAASFPSAEKALKYGASSSPTFDLGGGSSCIGSLPSLAPRTSKIRMAPSP